MKEIKMYECEFCHKKRLKTKKPMQRHEDACYFNPKNKACITCKYLCKEDYGREGMVDSCAIGIELTKKVLVRGFMYETKTIPHLKYKCDKWKLKEEIK